MDETSTDPLAISKDSDLIKDAQKDFSKIDILVCGNCVEIFHFVEEFQEHKQPGKCTGEPSVQSDIDEKPQVWGFTLWKTRYVKKLKGEGAEPPSSWEIYQKWVKLDQNEKDVWISAGRTLRYCNRMAAAKVQEVPAKVETKPEKDPLALDDSADQPATTNEDKPGEESKTAVRSASDNIKEEFNVEKIVGKRFNPKKRFWEYQVKWENYKEETWEPLLHLDNCTALVQEYESNLKAQKEKDKVASPRPRGRPRVNPIGGGTPTPVKVVQKKHTPTIDTAVIISSEGRPQRTSKQKALNQVKQWCGNISDTDEPTSRKRSLDDDDDSDDSYEKKIKLEADSPDTEEDERRPPSTAKKVAKIIHTYNNGVGAKLPENILIPDAKGVVRISQKQLPSLSSGVYIMSKSSGIIKLDPAASKIATSGGQAIVKVGPKIGQTQIRIIKKDDSNKAKVLQMKVDQSGKQTRLVQDSIKIQSVSKPSATPIKKDLERSVMKKPDSSKPAAPKESPIKIDDDESDYGLEELEFPTDLPLPEPDSPPRDFTLDPITGKIAGQEYPEPTKNEELENSKTTPTETIDNIVKLAAADITEDDLKPDEPVVVAVAETTDPAAVITTASLLTVTTSATDTVTSTSSAANEHMYAVVTTAPQPKTKQSILNTAIANSNILQKTLMTPINRPKSQPRIINQVVASKPRTTVSPLMRTSTPKAAVVRSKPPLIGLPPKPKFNIATKKSPAPLIRAVYSKPSNVAQKIGNTTVYRTKTYPPSQHHQVQQIKAAQTSSPPIIKKVRSSPAIVSKPAATPPKPAAPKPVISMPSLTIDDEPAVIQAAEVAAANDSNVAVVTEADLSAFTLAATDRPMFITGDDGTIYQVAGQNEEGQTILLTQDNDGQQQCLLVTSEALQDTQQVAETTPAEVMMEVQEQAEAAEEQPVVAQFLRTEPPSPGGTHKVVVMLPDGDVMITQVTPEEYASLELDK